MKFGLKKKDPTAGGGEKKAKRKSPKGRGDAIGKLKTFFASHIEKLLLGAMAVVALYLVYAGFSQESLDTDPDTVKVAVNQARSSIDSSTWAEVKIQRQPESDRFDQQAMQNTDDIDLAAYTLNVPFHPRMQKQSKKRIDPELLAPFDIEVRPGYGAVAIKSTGRESSIAGIVGRSSPDLRPLPSGFGRKRGSVPLGQNYESRFFVAITGLVPYKKQFDLYTEAFKGAPEYDIERDVPQYLGVMIERAEIKPDGSLAEWQPIDTLSGKLREPRTWDGRAEERADTAYLLDGLAMKLPPLVLRDASVWARHSSVPLVDPNAVDRGSDGRRNGQGRGDERGVEGNDEGESVSWFDEDASGGGERRGGANRDRADRSTNDSMDDTEVAEPLLKVENAMLRYFDFTVEPGKAYRYRVQALLDDPNNPRDGNKPSVVCCATDVVVRRQSVSEPGRLTPWSESSPATVVPDGRRVLAGTARAPKMTTVVSNPRVRIKRKATDEPVVTLMTLTWKKDGPYDVPVVVQAGRGAVLNGAVAETDAIDPAASKIRTLRGYKYVTDAMVLDIYGGSSLGNELTAPGFVLIRDANGRLEIHTEMDDFDQLESNTLPPDEEEEARAEELRREKEEMAEGRGDDGRGERMRGPRPRGPRSRGARGRGGRGGGDDGGRSNRGRRTTGR